MTALKMPHDISKRLNWTVTLTLLFSSRISCNLVKPWQTACLRLPLMSALTDWERKTDKERDKERDKHKQKWHSGSKKSLGQKDVRDGSRDWDGKKEEKRTQRLEDGESQSRRVRLADGSKERQRRYQWLSRETKWHCVLRLAVRRCPSGLRFFITAPDNTSPNPRLSLPPLTSQKTQITLPIQHFPRCLLHSEDHPCKSTVPNEWLV